MLSYAPYFSASDERFQIDLVYKRKDNLWTVCEIKYSDEAISTAVIPEVERKIRLLSVTNKISIEKMLIAPHGADKSLIQSQYFHHVITMKELLY